MRALLALLCLAPAGCGLLFGSREEESNSERARTDLKVLEERVLVWRRSHGELPASLAEVRLSSDADRGWPLDPWGRPYRFERDRGRHGFLLSTFGRDGAPGGEGEDRDLDNDSLAP